MDGYQGYGLVLSRHVGEKIVIGDNIVITVCEIRSDGKVRLGFEAPKDMSICRPEAINKEPRHG
jgi:carbon storage regulator